MIPKTLYVILDKKDFAKILEKNSDVFTLNEYVLSEEEKEFVNNIFPDPFKTALNSENIFLKTQNIKDNIIQKTKKIKFFKSTRHLDELLEPLLEMKISSLLYIDDIIPLYKEYTLIFKGKLYKFSSKSDLIFAIENIYSKIIDKNQILSKFSQINYNFYNNILLKVQTKLLSNIFKFTKKEIIFFSDKEAYFIKKLKKEVSSPQSLNLFYTPTNSYLRIFQIILKQTFLLLFKINFKEIGMFILPSNNLYFDYSYLINNIDFFRIDGLDLKYSKYLIKQIYSNILHSQGYHNYLKQIFKNCKIKSSYFHSVRYSDLFSFSRVLNLYNKNIYMISHGSHTVQKENKLDILSSKSLGIGMTFTNEKGIKVLSQSSYCDDFLDSLQKKYFRINRLIQKDIVNKKDENTIENKSITKILFVGTVKQLGARRYYVESSAEFIASVNFLCKKLFKHKNLFKITLRIRNVTNEINDEILHNAFKDKKDLIELGKNNSIYEEIDNCDCLISYSSTTLEEAILLNKPVMSFGLPKYNHFSFYECPSKNYEKFNICENLQTIEKCLGRKFIYKKASKRKINYKFL